MERNLKLRLVSSAILSVPASLMLYSIIMFAIHARAANLNHF